MTTEKIAIIGAISTVIAAFGGAALGAYFSHLSGKKLVDRTHKLAQQQVFNAAAINFRNAFNIAIYHIYSGQDETIVIGNNFSTHAEAIRIFMNYINKDRLSSFNEAWIKYQKWHNAMCNRGTTSELFPKTDSQYIAMKETKGIYLIKELFKYAEIKL